MDLVGCRVCHHESREEIERAAGEPGAIPVEVAARYGVTKAALVKHAKCPRATVDATTGSPPERSASAPAPRRTARRAPTTAAPVLEEPAPVLEDEPPATSRSEDLISARTISTPKTAREKVERLVDSLQQLLDDARDEERESVDDSGARRGGVPLGARLAVLRAMVQPLRLLGAFTGELGASDATIAASPFFKRVRVAVVDALRPYPEAAKAVIEALERVERGGSDSPDLEAAAE